MGLGVMQALTMPARNAMVRSLGRAGEMRTPSPSTRSRCNRRRWSGLARRRHIAFFGVGPTLATSAALSLTGIVLLQTVRMHPRRRYRTSNQMRELADGLKYCMTTPRIHALTSMGLLAGCFGLCYSHVAPGYSREVLGFDAGETGLFLHDHRDRLDHR